MASQQCVVPGLRGKTLGAARKSLARSKCRLGGVSRGYSKTRKNRIVSQRPDPGTIMRVGGKVSVRVSRGAKPRARR